MIDRFTQISPTVLLAVDGYRYGGKAFLRRDGGQLRDSLPSLRRRCTFPCSAGRRRSAGDDVGWDELHRDSGRAGFTPVPFAAPLWVLYSSGTTGLPKPIVHGHGGILVEHLKSLRLHMDLGPGDRFLWFTTTGWMMWNFLSAACWSARPSSCTTAAPATRT